MKNYNIGIVGATGMVGRTFLKILEEKNFPIDHLYLFASSKSKGEKILFRSKEYVVEELNEDSFNKPIDIALFSAGGEISKKFAPIAKSKKIVVIDNSSTWRLYDDVPLVVPEVNPEDVLKHDYIISNPNCSTIQSVVPLKPLDDAYHIKRIIFSTYQAVSGSGVGGVKDLENGLKNIPPKKYPYPIAFNCLPHIDEFTDTGYTKEELKMIYETRKILHRNDLNITATTVRVPVMYSHSVSANVEFDKDFELEELVNVLRKAKGIILMDNPKENIYPMPIIAEGTDEVYVGRIRRDFSVKSGVNLWIVADNIRKGAATNTVQIAELLIKNQF
ncbi:aspartate-semialdehyde dehydrogenase [Acidilutibacter cellobiosedens]|jgi:aspartate-semialdehyde dehydrogenase|uniref:Aspartate-semialdehyde dehydrogenase n=1 Tax=Acidilutibacter cellobiosedens TaxID=2507161 RepID=A0A410QBE4_9FIRM|nr:aspartate-semialdehyde dehydrogenase [Acidilutibacter cellobiosedens]MBE6082157.1 aspartate-semialdehyde dehydrogenase [Tissierellaceae bacterium]QAT61323.1 aspartate-semialdehyde dehydrogenase [Acidilutibacter cellobiosedens]